MTNKNFAPLTEEERESLEVNQDGKPANQSDDAVEGPDRTKDRLARVYSDLVSVDSTLELLIDSIGLRTNGDGDSALWLNALRNTRAQVQRIHEEVDEIELVLANQGSAA